MSVTKLASVGIVVDDLEAVTAFFVQLGLEPGYRGVLEGEWVDRVVGLEGVRTEIAMLDTPDSYRLCYVRGPEGIIVMLAEQLSRTA